MVQLTNGQHTCELVFKPKVDILNICHDCQFVFYFMNFMFHTMLDAAGVVLSVHYESIKCDVLCSQGSVRTTVQKLYKSIEISQSYDHKCTATVHSVDRNGKMLLFRRPQHL